MPREIIRPVAPGRFPLLLDNEAYLVAMANMSQYEIVLHQSSITGMLYVGVVGRGCYNFDSYVAAPYVQDKMKIEYSSDAKALSDFINSQLDIGWDEWDPTGEYRFKGLLDPMRVGSEVVREEALNEGYYVVKEFQRSHMGPGMDVLIARKDHPPDEIVVSKGELRICT